VTRVLFVCLGNICRSPSAEAVFRAQAEAAGLATTIDSAGTGGWHIGNPPYRPMIDAAWARGYDLTPLRARQVRARDFDDFDLIIAMDGANRDVLEGLRPTGNATPVELFLSFADTSVTDVPDPYYTRDFDGALDLIEAASRGLIAQLQTASATSPNER